MFRKCSYGIALFGLITMFCACNKYENIATPDLGYAYYPLQVNTATIYDVDSTVYDDFTGATTKHLFQLKDSVTTLLNDALNQRAFRIERYKKLSGSNWTFQKVITKNNSSNRAEEFVDNKRYVRLVFPPTLNRTWNGNTYNNMEPWTYQITRLDESQTLNTVRLDSTLTVSQYNEVNLIREDVYTEVYAKHIGLVMKEIRALDKDINTGRIKRGLSYRLQFNSKK